MFVVAAISLIVAIIASYYFIHYDMDKLTILYRIISVLWLVVLTYLLIFPEVFFGVTSIKENMNFNEEIWRLNVLKPIAKKDVEVSLKINQNISDYIIMLSSISRINKDDLIKKDISSVLADYLNAPSEYIDYLFKYHCIYSKKEFEKHIVFESSEAGF